MPSLSTVYIMSKGRPRCASAKTLTSLRYPGDWYIVCGDNDETLPEYVENWGSERVLVFGWRRYAEQSDLMDNFGLDGLASGAAPARNAIRDFSAARGELRHWQFDDDFSAFTRYDSAARKFVKVESGEELALYLDAIARFGAAAGASDVGFCTQVFARAQKAGTATPRVFCAHNMPSTSGFVPWRARVSDDAVQLYDTLRRGGFQLSVNCFTYSYKGSATQAGGNTELYNATGYVKKCAYAMLAAPSCVRMAGDAKSGYMVKPRYSVVTPKFIDSRWQK